MTDEQVEYGGHEEFEDEHPELVSHTPERIAAPSQLMQLMRLLAGITLASGALLGLLLVFGGQFGGWVVLGLFIILTISSFKEIEEDPPHKGLVTVWGRRMYKAVLKDDVDCEHPQQHYVREAVILEEGLRFIPSFFPFLVSVVKINVQKKNEDFWFTDVRCRRDRLWPDAVLDNPTLGQKVISGELEYHKLREHLIREGLDPKDFIPDNFEEQPRETESGGSTKVGIAITWEPDTAEAIEYINTGKAEGVREILEDMLGEDLRQMGQRLTWEQLAFAKDGITARLITKLSGKTLREDEVVEQFLRRCLVNGVSDIWDLGIRIRRLNVENVEPEGELKNDAERVAREQQQRAAELYEADTLVAMAKTIKGQRPGISWNDAYNLAQAAQGGKIRRVVIEGSGDGLTRALAATGIAGQEGVE